MESNDDSVVITVKMRHVKCYFTLVLLRREYS